VRNEIKIRQSLSPAEFTNVIKQADSMNETSIIALVIVIFSTTGTLAFGVRVPEMKPCILHKEFISHPDGSIKEFTMATCRCFYHQKCLEKYS
jgi:hypothetical protein